MERPLLAMVIRTAARSCRSRRRSKRREVKGRGMLSDEGELRYGAVNEIFRPRVYWGGISARVTSRPHDRVFRKRR